MLRKENNIPYFYRENYWRWGSYRCVAKVKHLLLLPTSRSVGPSLQCFYCHSKHIDLPPEVITLAKIFFWVIFSFTLLRGNPRYHMHLSFAQKCHNVFVSISWFFDHLHFFYLHPFKTINGLAPGYLRIVLFHMFLLSFNNLFCRLLCLPFSVVRWLAATLEYFSPGGTSVIGSETFLAAGRWKPIYTTRLLSEACVFAWQYDYWSCSYLVSAVSWFYILVFFKKIILLPFYAFFSFAFKLELYILVILIIFCLLLAILDKSFGSG